MLVVVRVEAHPAGLDLGRDVTVAESSTRGTYRARYRSVGAQTLRTPPRGCSSMAEHQLPKLTVRVRFPSPAPRFCRTTLPGRHAVSGYPQSVTAPWRLLGRRLRGELALFGGVGAVNLAGDIVFFNLFAFEVGMPPLVAKSVSMVITGTIAFFGHRHLTFRHRRGGGVSREVPLFVAVTLASVVLSLLPLFVARHVLGLTGVFWLNVANLFGIALGTIARYFSYRGVVWKHAHVAAIDLTTPSAHSAALVD